MCAQQELQALGSNEVCVRNGLKTGPAEFKSGDGPLLGTSDNFPGLL